MDVNYYKQYEPIFGAWKIKRKLGEGNFGAVYEIEREDFGTTYHAALKTITIPKNQAELDSILDDGMDATTAESYLEQFVEKIVSEFVLMSKLKGNSHIVSYEDHQVIKHKDGIGWDILIRMELLTPLMSYMKTTSITKRDVIKLGIDMCRALELCQKYNIIHRDIKPENIFISDSGDFKLGDFGIAKEVEKTQSGLTKTGTQTYMAPEVYKGQPYGSSVDMYSLGVVLYRLLNHNRAPFMPKYPEPISYSDRERALIMRMGGHRFPTPSGVEEGCRLAEIAMKACSFNPDDRYSSPTQMREDLEAIFYTEGEGILMFPSGDAIDIKSVKYVSNSKNPNRTEYLGDEQTEIMEFDDATEVMEDVRNRFNTNSKTSEAKKKKPFKFILPIVFVIVLLIAGSVLLINYQDASKSLEVSSIQELSEPIELKFESPAVTDSDYEIISKRLKSYGMKYYIDKASSTIAVAKADLGSSEIDIFGTIDMITCKGEIELTNFEGNSEYTLTNADFENSFYKFDGKTGKSTLVLRTTESGKEKLEKLTAQIEKSNDNAYVSVVIDGSFGNNILVAEQDENGSITLVAYNGDKGKENGAGKFLKLISSIVNDGALNNSYKIYSNDLLLPEEVVETNATEATEETEDPIVEENSKNSKPDTTTKKSSTPNKPTAQSQTQQSVQQQQEQQTPVQQQPIPQQPEQQVPAQQQTIPPAGNPAGMPEIYIDFD